MAEEQIDHDALISQLSSLTGLSPSEARDHLVINQWNLSSAATEWFTSLEEAAAQPSPHDQHIESYSDQHQAPALLDSTPRPIPTSSSMPPPPSASQEASKKKRFATLGDLGGGGGSAHAGHGHDDDDNDEDFDPDQDLFAGGEKSGLAVHNPDDLKKKIIEKAKKNARRPGGDDPRGPASRFTGTAHTLGGDDTPSQIVEDPNASKPREKPLIKRILHFWEDGFSVDDGPLYRSDDPANADTLRMIRSGSAPLAIMNVERSQEVDVELQQHPGKYEKPKMKYTPFSGGGQRLGSPTPAPGPNIEESRPTPAATNTNSATQGDSTVATVDVNDSEPIISLQIRLGDGTRLMSRFNITHTVGDVYSFVTASSPSSQGREWVLMTTFPSKELKDKAQVLGDLAEFKRGGVVVQKWQ